METDMNAGKEGGRQVMKHGRRDGRKAERLGGRKEGREAVR